ncbi:MAG: type III pantothenate kinase [Cryomorphaceae bacterium]|nr:type III pantothenate kinase [Cryomorphaceae bacterium]
MIAVDAGNTTIKVLKYSASGEAGPLQKWPASRWEECATWLSTQSEPIWISDSAGRSWPLGTVVDYRAPWSFTLDYTERVGSDRLAGMEGALVRYPGASILMVSCGTCLTFSYLHQGKRFQGGGIAPGWLARLRSMVDYTGSLPPLGVPDEAAWSSHSGMDPRTASTEESMHRGSLMGMIDQVRAEVQRFQHLDPDLKLILHGGDARALVGHIKNGIFADENWIALGLWSVATRS